MIANNQKIAKLYPQQYIRVQCFIYIISYILYYSQYLLKIAIQYFIILGTFCNCER